MGIHSLLTTAALSLGLALTAPEVFAQEETAGAAIRRWPTAATLDGGAVAGGERISVEPGRLEQRRSPSGGGGGSVRGGGGGGGGRVAVPRGSVGGGGRPGYPAGGGRYPYPAGRYYAPYYRGYYPYYGYGYPYPYYYPYSAFYWGGGYFNSYGYWGVGVGWPGYAYPAYGYPYPAAYGYGYDVNTGRVRLDVQPRDAEVFIDGSFAGWVDDFDGRLLGLTLETGSYNVEIRKPGWETLSFDVRITPGRTTTYKSEMLPKKE